MNLRFLKHIYTTPIISTCYRQREAFKVNNWRQKQPGSPFHATHTVYLRGPKDPEQNWDSGDPCVDYPLLGMKEWQNAKRLIERIRRAVIEDIESNKIPVVLGETGKVYIENLSAESVIEWRAEEPGYAEKHIRMLLLIETNPGVVLYAGGLAQHLEVGALTWMNTRCLHSMLNLGTYPAVTFIADFAVQEGE